MDEIARYLDNALGRAAAEGDAGSTNPPRAEPYHAGLTPEARYGAHSNFLVGRTAVVVATVAFGMGIDKPDVRRVIHWGPPKTVEEYYQQIGRAGRDGLTAEVTMYANLNEFDNYNSDFYLGRLGGEAREASIKSTSALREYAADGETCRRFALLRFFGEKPKFGERCGTCDSCRDRAEHGDDAERDFSDLGARVALRAASDLNGQGMSVLVKAMGGGTVEAYRYRHGMDPSRSADAVRAERDAMKRKRPASFLKEMISPLVRRGYMSESTRTVSVPGSSYKVRERERYFSLEFLLRSSRRVRLRSRRRRRSFFSLII